MGRNYCPHFTDNKTKAEKYLVKVTAAGDTMMNLMLALCTLLIWASLLYGNRILLLFPFCR